MIGLPCRQWTPLLTRTFDICVAVLIFTVFS
jgi:hypothetical protein